MTDLSQYVSDVEFTGLTDTAVGYTGSSTLDSSVDPGSPLPLVIGPNRNQRRQIGGRNDPARFTMGTHDLWNNPSSMASLQFSGVSDPPFASQGQSTPQPYAAPQEASAYNAFHGLSKYGSAIATLLGNHPKTIASSPSQLHGNQAGILTHSAPSLTGSNTIVIAVVVFAAALLLWRAE